jgi:hypothetical protein
MFSRIAGPGSHERNGKCVFASAGKDADDYLPPALPSDARMSAMLGQVAGASPPHRLAVAGEANHLGDSVAHLALAHGRAGLVHPVVEMAALAADVVE